MIRKIHVLIALLLFSMQSYGAFGQSAKPLSPDQQKLIIQEISKFLNQFYVFPETALQMQQRIESRLQEGAYSGKTDSNDFANAVMADLSDVSKDKHLSFHYDPEQAHEIVQVQSKNEEQSKSAREHQLSESRRDNFGFRKVERLSGNVGYLDFRYFASAGQAGETAIAALNFLANCDAIIVDLRQNGGGDPTQIQLISSYFFKEHTHLNDIYTRSENSTENFWTYPYVPGRKLQDADLYILTSKYTFSGAEEFSYNMKSLKRATLIGERTGGGAHPTSPHIVQADFVLSVPYARAINPITKTNWEGTGVSPDIEIPADKAFDQAYRIAIERLAAKTADESRKNELVWVQTGLQAKLHPVIVSEDTLQRYAAIYGERKVTFENGSLFYQRTGPKFRLVPLTETVFAPEGLDGFRLEFVLKDGQTVEVIGLYEDGRKEPSKRTS